MSTFDKCVGGGGRRSVARSAAPLIALVTTRTETRSAVVVDVSVNGARLQGQNLPSKWADMFLHVEGLVRFATVQWEDGDERGVVFDTPLLSNDEQFLQAKVSEAQELSPEIKAAQDDWVTGVAH